MNLLFNNEFCSNYLGCSGKIALLNGASLFEAGIDFVVAVMQPLGHQATARNGGIGKLAAVKYYMTCIHPAHQWPSVSDFGSCSSLEGLEMLAWTRRFSSACITSAYIWAPGGLLLLLVHNCLIPAAGIFVPALVLSHFTCGDDRRCQTPCNGLVLGPLAWTSLLESDLAPRNFDREHPGSIYTSATVDISRIGLNDWFPLPLAYFLALASSPPMQMPFL